MKSETTNQETGGELAPPIGYASFRDVQLNDPYVASIMNQGGTAEMCVIELANQKNELLKRVVELESIAPRKLKLEDGRVMVWHCPDELIPMMPNAAGEVRLPDSDSKND